MGMSNPDLRPILDSYGTTYRETEGSQRVCCPVHTERSPSCTVNLGEGWFRCFHDPDCKGDAYSLVRAVEGCGFPEAKALVEKLTGQEYQQEKPAETVPVRKFRGGGYKPKVKRRSFR